jgi:hypothetical protein
MPEFPTFSDEHRVLRGPGGLERTETKYRRLLDKSGFHQLAIYPAGLFSVFEARAC